MPPVKIGVLLPTRGIILADTAPQNSDLIINMAELVEEASLDSVWVGDSLYSKPRMEPLSTLAAIASRTKKVRLGTSVLLAALRHPVMLSQAINTLDLLSSGRAVIATGAGGAFTPSQVKELEVAGVDISTRGKRLEEVVHIIKLLENNLPVTFKGQFFELDNVTMQPKPVQTGGVPILFACHTRAKREAQFKRAALLGNGLISISESPLEFAQAIKKVKELEKKNQLKVIEKAILRGYEINNGELTNITLSINGNEEMITGNQLLVFFGLSPKLGPIAEWGLDINKKAIEVNTETYETNQKGIFAIGDIANYPGKKKLILSGFHESALAAFAAKAIIEPGKKVHLQYTTTSPKLQERLGLKNK